MAEVPIDSENAEPLSVDLIRLLSVAQLPGLPHSAIRLLELSRDPENGPAEFAVPIESDPGLASQVLRFVNSSYFGFPREIATVKLAITLVGIRTVKNFALWSAVFSLIPNPKCGSMDLRNLWQDSLRRAWFSRAMTRALGLKDAEAPFAAALLQDIAIPLLARELPDEYETLLKERKKGRVRLSDLERERFGWTHAEAGAVIARGWNLPAELADLIERHTESESLLDEKAGPAELSVALSSFLPASCDETWIDLEAFESQYEGIGGASSQAVVDLLSDIDQQLIDFAPVLKLETPAKSLVQYYHEATLTIQQ